MPSMANHPNRSRAGTSPARNPAPAEIRATREGAGLTARQAADLVHVTERNWFHWEHGDRQMHPAFWELFRLKLIANNVRVE